MIPEKEFCNWLCGIIDGDGFFEYRANERRRAFTNGKEYFFREVTCSVGISLRSDDLRTLRFIRYKTNVGNICNKYSYNTRSKPGFTWKVSKIEDLLNTMIPIFDSGFLVTRKREEYVLWKKGVFLKHFVSNIPRNTRNEKMWNNDYFEEAVKISKEISRIKEYRLWI